MAGVVMPVPFPHSAPENEVVPYGYVVAAEPQVPAVAVTDTVSLFVSSIFRARRMSLAISVYVVVAVAGSVLIFPLQGTFVNAVHCPPRMKQMPASEVDQLNAVLDPGATELGSAEKEVIFGDGGGFTTMTKVLPVPTFLSLPGVTHRA
jgi:hypothetical protein